MASKFQQEALKIVVAQICQIIGFQGIYSAPLDVLIDLLHRYLKEIAVTTHRYCEHYGRTEPNIDDLGQAFQEMGISISDLEEYVSYVEPIGFPHKTPKLPVPKSSDLNFLKPGARENLSRPLHVHEHLPPMQPDKEDEEVNLSNHLEEEASGSEAPEESPASPSQGKRSSEAEVSPSKKLRPCPEEEGEPVREIDSVMMTTSGYISSAREGKMPEPRRPTIPMAHPRSGSPTAGGPAKLIKKKVTMEKIIWNKNHKTGILPGPLAKPKGKHLKLKPKIPLAPPGTGSLKHMRSPSRGQAPKLKIPNLTKKEEPKDGAAVTKETPPVVSSPPKKSVIPTPAPPPVEKEGGGEKKRKKDREAERRRRREKEREERKEARREAAAEGMTPSAFRKERTRIRLRGLSKEEELRRYKERENELIAALAASSAVTITSIPPTSLRVREKTPERSPPPPVSAPGGGGVGGPPCPPLTPSPAKSKLSVFKKLPKGGREGGERDSSPDLMIDDMMVKEEKPSPPPSPRDEFPIMFREEAAFSGVGTAPPNPDVHLPLLMPKAIKKEKEPQKRQKPQKPQKSPKPQKLPKPPKLPKTPKPPKSPKSQKPQKPPKPKKERVKKKSPKEKGTHGVKKGGSVTTFNPTWRNPAEEQLSPDRPKTPEAGQNPIPGDIGTPPLFTISPFRHGPSLIPPPFSRFPFIPPFGAPPRPPLPDINPISHMFLGVPPLVDQKGFETMESGDRPPTPSLDLAVRALTPPPLSLKEHRSPVPPMDKSPPPLSHPTKKAPENPIGLQTVRGEKPDKKEKKEHKKERKKKEEEKEEKEKKKEEKEKEKLKKKKDKRDKEKAKEEKKKEKKEEKERLKKEKKEKKEKKGAAAASTVATTAAASASTTATTPAVSSLESVPKLTLKFQAENGDTDTKTSDTKVTPKLVIKPVVKRPSDELPVQIHPPEKKRKKNTPSPSPPSPIGPPRVLHQEGPCSPPEIAKFSALVMRPPKGSQTKKGSETLTVPPLKIKDSSMKASSKKEIGSIVGGTKAELKESTVPPLKIKNSLPQISVPPKPAPEPKQTSASRKSEKKERKKKNAPLIITSLAGVAVEPINSPPPMVSPPAQLPPPIPIPSEMPSSKSSKKSSGGAGFSASSGASSSKASSGLLTETVGPIGHFVDDQGNEVWICPTCGKQDDGSPMIGCDTCDDWYHWICVGIHVPPSERENWYCPRCLSQHKQQQRGTMGVEKKKRGRKKKNP